MTAPKDACGVEFENYVQDTYLKLVRLYVLAEKLQDVPTKNAIMQKIWSVHVTGDKDGCCYIPLSETVCEAYEGTTEDSLMRLFLMDLWLETEPEEFEKNVATFPREFLDKFSVLVFTRLNTTAAPFIQHDGVERYMEQEKKTA